jgi:maltokinase
LLEYRSGPDSYALVLIEEMVVNEGTAWEAWQSLIVNPVSDDDLMADASFLGETIAEMHLGLEQMSRKLGRYQPVDRAFVEEKINTLLRIIRDDLAVHLKDTAGPASEKLKALCSNIKTLNLGWRFRIHGDLHLEQILKTASGWKVIDFEGEPLKSIAERGIWDSPLKDVASLLRSVSYRVHSLYPVISGNYETELQQQIINGYLNAYHKSGGQFLPAPDSITKLLDLFQWERVVYEYIYELKYRPDWVRIPEAGLKKLVEKE